MDKQDIIKRLEKNEDKLFVSKVLDKIERCRKINQTVHTDFMDPYQRKLIESFIHKTEGMNFHFSGGFEDAERVVLFICPDYIEPMDLDWEEYFTPLGILVKNSEKLTHRDYLGSLMGLGIKREKIGDIVISKDIAQIIAFNEIADYIEYNLIKIGRESVQIERIGLEDLFVKEIKSKDISGFVASLRVDCIASIGFGISRSKIAQLINAEKLNLNWGPLNNTSKILKEGDTISLRGKGRMVIESIGNMSKKGRIFVNIKRLV